MNNLHCKLFLAVILLSLLMLSTSCSSSEVLEDPVSPHSETAVVPLKEYYISQTLAE